MNAYAAGLEMARRVVGGFRRFGLSCEGIARFLAFTSVVGSAIVARDFPGEARMAEHDIARDWFLAQYKPNAHKVALRNLQRQGFEVFLPMSSETVRRDELFKTVLKPLFPGYLFVAFDPRGAAWRTINSTYGVTRLVQFNDQPKSVPEDLVEGLKKRCNEAGELQVEPATFLPGEEVRIGHGAFADFVATVEQMTSDRRVWVLLDLLGRSTRVAVKISDLRSDSPIGSGAEQKP